MNGNAKRAKLVAAFVIAAGMVLTSAPPAIAATGSWSCGGGSVMKGTQGTSGAQTQEATDCYTIGVRVHYAHVGGSSWTTWETNSSYVIRAAPNTFGSAHNNTRNGAVQCLPIGSSCPP
jgi:hypothetical protein